MKELDEIFNDWDEEEFEETEKYVLEGVFTEFDKPCWYGGTGSNDYINNTTIGDYTISGFDNISTGTAYITVPDNCTISNNNNYTYTYTADLYNTIIQ